MDFEILSRTNKIFLENFSIFPIFSVNRLFIQGRFKRDKKDRANFFPFGLYFFKLSLMEQARKARYGQYFTIVPIADFMVSLISKGKSAKILEPSCGKGVFIEALQKRNFSNIEDFEIDRNLPNPFSCVKYKSFVSTPATEKYDCIIGNPPYIRWKNLESELKEELASSSLWNTYFNSLCDYLFIFILKSIEQLNENGELIFICTDYWLNTTHAKALRNYMVDSGFFESIYHFNEASLFENVTASFIIFKYIKGKQPKKPITLYEYTKRQRPTKSDLKGATSFIRKSIPPFQKNARWILDEDGVQQQISSLERICQKNDFLFPDSFYRIGDFCDIGNGMVSGLDKAFNLSEVPLTPKERSQTIPVVKAKDIQPYTYRNTSTYLFSSDDSPFKTFAKNYPNIGEHLRPRLPELSKRYSYGKNLEPQQFAFPRNQQLFERNCPKIFVPCKDRITARKKFRFCLVEAGIYALQDVTGIVPQKNMKESIYYLLAFLNTEEVYNWLYHNGIKKGDVVEFSEAPISSVPYRPIDWENSKEAMLHDSIVSDVKDYLRAGDTGRISAISQAFKTLFREAK